MWYWKLNIVSEIGQEFHVTEGADDTIEEVYKHIHGNCWRLYGRTGFAYIAYGAANDYSFRIQIVPESV